MYMHNNNKNSVAIPRIFLGVRMLCLPYCLCVMSTLISINGYKCFSLRLLATNTIFTAGKVISLATKLR